MRKVLLLGFLSTLLFTNSFSQNSTLERSIQFDYDMYLNSFVYDSTDGKYVLGGYYEDVSSGFFSPPYLSKIDSSGNTAWNQFPYIFSSEVAHVNRIATTHDGNLIFSGFEVPTCDIAGGDFGFLQKISPQGNLLFTKTYFPPNNNFYSSQNFGLGLVSLNNNSIRVSIDSLVYHLDSNGDSLTFNTYHKGIIREIIKTPDDYLLLACDSGLIKTDTSGNIIHTLSNINVRNVCMMSANEYFLNSGTLVYKTDSALNIIYQNNLQPSISSINKIKTDQSTLWIVAKDQSSGNSALLKLNDTLAFVSSHSFLSYNGNDFDAIDIIINPSEYLLAGYEKTDQSKHVFVKSFNKLNDSSFVYQNDVGLISLRADSSYAYPISFSSNYIVYLDMYGTIKNFGTSIINSTYINAYFINIFPICLPAAYSETFTGLNLLPGDSIEVHIGYIADMPPGFSPQNNNYSVCFWTSSPNEKMDINHLNDKICHTFTIVNFTGIDKTNSENEITFSPNPFTDFSTVALNLKNSSGATATLYDIAGQKISSIKLFQGKNKLSYQSLAKGTYFLKVNTSKNTITKKIVKI